MAPGARTVTHTREVARKLPSGRGLLEKMSVSAATVKAYRKQVDRFLQYCQQTDLHGLSDPEVEDPAILPANTPYHAKEVLHSTGFAVERGHACRTLVRNYQALVWRSLVV